MRAIRILAIPAIVAALLIGAVPASAAPAPAPEGETVALAINTFANQDTGRCLDDSFAFGARPYPCNGLDFQKWYVRAFNDGTREFRNVATDRCLGADHWGEVTAGECGTSTQAHWYVKWWADRTFELKNQASSQCLRDIVWLSTATCDASREQSWY